MAPGSIPLHCRPVDLVALTRSTLEPLAKEASARDVGLTVDASGAGLDAVSVDPEKVAWAIATLVGNSLRYVRCGTRRMPGGSVGVRLRRDGPSVEIAVEDDGPGIPRDRLPYLFEREAGTQHAIGLALTLVHDVALAHGGDVHVESSTELASHGTTVRLTLPAR